MYSFKTYFSKFTIFLDINWSGFVSRPFQYAFEYLHEKGINEILLVTKELRG